jgi:hypothetical protein
MSVLLLRPFVCFCFLGFGGDLAYIFRCCWKSEMNPDSIVNEQPPFTDQKEPNGI